MKKILAGTTLAVFTLAPALGWADCDFHNKATMALTKPADKTEAPQALAASKASTAVAKTDSAKQAAKTKASAPSKADRQTVVAKNN
jgi:hypothetical protein